MSASRFRTWAPVVVWAAVIFALSSIPSLGTGLGTWDLILRKLAHMTEYAILGALLLRALSRPWLAIVIGALYAMSDEIHQHFVRGRHGAWYDVVIDTVGVTIGVVAWRRATGRWGKASASPPGYSRPGPGQVKLSPQGLEPLPLSTFPRYSRARLPGEPVERAAADRDEVELAGRVLAERRQSATVNGSRLICARLATCRAATIQTCRCSSRRRSTGRPRPARAEPR